MGGQEGSIADIPGKIEKTISQSSPHSRCFFCLGMDKLVLEKCYIKKYIKFTCMEMAESYFHMIEKYMAFIISILSCQSMSQNRDKTYMWPQGEKDT